MLIAIGTVLFLCFMEGLLSLDNAVVLAVMVQHLPKDTQKKALSYGIWGAFIFRAIALLLITVIVSSFWIKLVGGVYLLWLAYSYFSNKEEEEETGQNKVRSFWKTVLMIELMDITFSMDSILASVAISNVYWVLLTGGILGIIMMRFAAAFFVSLIEKYPVLEKVAYFLVGLIGLKLVAEQVFLKLGI